MPRKSYSPERIAAADAHVAAIALANGGLTEGCAAGVRRDLLGSARMDELAAQWLAEALANPIKKSGPDHCAKPVRCEVCPYPQPCDPQTVRAPKI